MELKPCPFCGSRHIVDDDGPGTFGESLVRYASKCKECGVSFWHPECDEHRNWNTRPIEDALLARAVEAERKLAVADGFVSAIERLLVALHDSPISFKERVACFIDDYHAALREIGGEHENV